MRASYLFTSESVSEGHPDKVCDRISDEIVDLFFREGPKAGIDPWAIRAACETLATTNKVVIAGETRGPKSVTNDQIESVVRAAIKDIGYEQEGFHWEKADIEILLHPQSADIAQGVDALQPGTNKEEGAGDQGIMFGYATNETPDLMPAPIFYAHKILRLISEARHSGKEKVLGPDSKSQVTVQYENGKPVGVREIVVSHQHLVEDMTSNQVRERRRALCAPGAAGRLDQRQDHLAHQSDRQILYRRSRRRRRPHRPQDHRRHLWRRGPAWRRRVLRQGPDQGGSFGGLRRALCRQEHRCRRSCRPLHAAARLRDRRGAAAVDLYRHPRHRKGAGGQAREGRAPRRWI